MKATTTRRILKKVASLLGKEEKLSSPIKEDVPSERYGGLTKTTATGVKNDATEFFFARVPPSVTYEELLEVFEKFGAVEHLNLFRPFAGAKTSKGCGIVRYSSSTAAAAARAELHDKHKWSSDYAPMVLERVNEKKKRSNISNDGTKELIFTPKFLTKAKNTTQQQQQQQQQQCVSRGGSCAGMLHGGEVQRHPSQSSSCSTLSAEGPMRFCSNSSMGSVGNAAMAGGDTARMSDRGCGLAASGYMAQFAIDTINSADCNAISSGSLLQPGGATAAGGCSMGGAGQVCSGSNLALVNSGQLLMAEHACLDSFEQQLKQQQQQQQARHPVNMGACGRQQHTAQAWRQQWQAAGTGLEEACAVAAGGAYLPSYRQLQGSQMLSPDAALSAAVAYAAMQPTSLSILAGSQQEQLGMQLTLGDSGKVPCGPSVLQMHGGSTLSGVTNAAAFEGLTMMPAGGAAGDSMGLPSLPSAFASNNECFSTYSNFLDGHPSMQLPTVGASGHFASLSAAANTVADAAAAADCRAGLFTSGNVESGAHASGAMLGCVMQQQRQLQQHAALQSGGNLQLSNGALCQAAGGFRDGMGDLAEMQKQHLLQLDGEWAGAGDSGYFDLYRSGSSLDSMKADETTGTSSCSYPNKLSSCSSSEIRHTLGSSAAAMALARQQQEQLLTISEQRKLQLAGLPVAQAALQVSVGAAPNHAGLFARSNGNAAGQQWPLQPPPPPPRQQQSMLPVSGSLFGGADITKSGSLLPLSGSSCKAEDDTITLDVPTTLQGVGAVAVHIDSIKSMSGAAMAIVPQPGGQLSFKLLGTPSQVHMAVGFIQVLLQKAEPC